MAQPTSSPDESHSLYEKNQIVKWLRPLLSIMAVAAAYFWSRLILPFRNEQMPFTGMGDGSGGNVATLAVPVILLWLATMLALCFVCFKPYFQIGPHLAFFGRLFTNLTMIPVALVLVLYVLQGPAIKILALYGFIALGGLWFYVDLFGSKTQEEKNH